MSNSTTQSSHAIQNETHSVSKWKRHGAASIVDLIAENRKPVAALLAFLIAALAGYSAWKYYRQHREQLAAQAYFEVIQQNQKSTAESESLKDPMANSLDATQIEKLTQLTKNHSGTTASFEALLKLGDFHLKAATNGDAAAATKALDAFKQAVQQAPQRSMKTLALYSLAYAYEATKEYKGAIETLRSALSNGEKYLKAELMSALARNLELSGDSAKATEQYQLIIGEFPNSTYSALAQKAVEQLKATAAPQK